MVFWRSFIGKWNDYFIYGFEVLNKFLFLLSWCLELEGKSIIRFSTSFWFMFLVVFSFWF